MNRVWRPGGTGQPSRMHGETAPRIPGDPVERELQALLAAEAERRRPDRIRPRGNPAIEAGDLERGREKLESVLGC